VRTPPFLPCGRLTGAGIYMALAFRKHPLPQSQPPPRMFPGPRPVAPGDVVVVEVPADFGKQTPVAPLPRPVAAPSAAAAVVVPEAEAAAATAAASEAAPVVTEPAAESETAAAAPAAQSPT
jgi:hypothetical protein